MEIYNGVSEFKGVKNPILTTGTFDGVHHGHRAIIKQLKTIADASQGEVTLLTFHPHPRMVLFPDDHGLQLLNSQEEKIKNLSEAGVEHLIIQKFDLKLANLSAKDYIRQIVVTGIDPMKVVVGYDHHFGKNRQGDYNLLLEYGDMFGFEVEELSAQMIDEVNVSSTKCRKAIANGSIDIANQYLGYTFSISGIVVEGKGVGSQIGIPTANISVSDPHKIIPGNGVYAISTVIKGKKIDGVANIGLRPTFDDSPLKSIECHFLNFNESIYGNELTISFHAKIRNEIKFDDHHQLVSQIKKDIESAKSYF